MATVIANKLNYNYNIKGSYTVGMTTNVLADKLSYAYNIVGALHSDSPLPLNPDLNVYYDCDGYDMYGDPFQGRLLYDYNINGRSLNTWVHSDKLNYNYIIKGEDIKGITVTADILEYDYRLKYAAVIIAMVKDSWVKWSKIGSLDFTQDQSNIAGEMPLYQCGKIYDLIQLDDFIIAYGSKSIIRLFNKETIWGQKRIYPKGSMGKNAQIGNINILTGGTDTHWFIDSYGDFYEVNKKEILKIGYKEYFSKLTNPVLSIDNKNNLIYICDATYGFVYSIKDQSLCSCVDNITGIIYFNSVNYTCSSSTLNYPTVSFVTNIFDFETRKEKTIFNVELTTAGTEKMEIRIAYRNDKASSFAYTPWALVNPQGIVYLPCYGREFKICFRLENYENIKIDQMKINGVIHGFSHLDARRG